MKSQSEHIRQVNVLCKLQGTNKAYLINAISLSDLSMKLSKLNLTIDSGLKLNKITKMSEIIVKSFK